MDLLKEEMDRATTSLTELSLNLRTLTEMLYDLLTLDPADSSPPGNADEHQERLATIAYCARLHAAALCRRLGSMP